MTAAVNPEILREKLSAPLPGKQAQQRMAPPGRDLPGIDPACRDAAVMILLYPHNGQVHLVFIKRNEYEGPHSGQISFPGGMHEEKDRDLQFTALRETEEETGVNRRNIGVLGKLTPLYIPVSNFCVTPFVGWIPFQPDFLPDRSEVQYLLLPTLQELSDPLNCRSEAVHIHGKTLSAPCFMLEGEMIWGATAMILSEFMAVLD